MSNCYLKFWILKRENINESGPAGIEVGLNSVYMQIDDLDHLECLNDGLQTVNSAGIFNIFGLNIE